MPRRAIPNFMNKEHLGRMLIFFFLLPGTRNAELLARRECANKFYQSDEAVLKIAGPVCGGTDQTKPVTNLGGIRWVTWVCPTVQGHLPGFCYPSFNSSLHHANLFLVFLNSV